ncbi:NUDIX hydrolase [Candidatus Nanohalococcus occultus]|uniref:NUDIX family hydrolase n=1 Tax=Candidatus Nanohalococcus occultus TaxID=2978047 RepID=A0ABY8CHK4_9ARCH|nr:NUDIX family hydrolase [Candidatus Nanohaloarchaeota archaeon SVXNc]
MRDKFRVVVKAWITRKNKTLIGKKEEDPDHPIGGQWHFLGGHVEHGEDLKEALLREVKEETGLEVNVHQLIDAQTYTHGEKEKNSIQFLYHCEAKTSDAEAQDDLADVQWLMPDELKDELVGFEVERLENREEQSKFLEKLKKMPSI